ncbi:MAG: Kelch repeat-containing protein [Gemmatimonadales bacterium]
MSRRHTCATTSLLSALALLAGCGDDASTPVESAVPDLAVQAAALATNSWTHFADLPSERRNVILAAVPKANGNTRLFAIGGDAVAHSAKGTTFAPVTTAYEWLPGLNKWARRADAPYLWQYPVPPAAVIGSKVYIPAGFFKCSNCQVPRDTMAVYDASTDTWARSVLPQYATGGVVWSFDDRLYWAGLCNDAVTGDGDMDFTYCRDTGARTRFLLRYNPSTNVWRYLTPPPRDHADGVTGTIGGKLYVAGTGGQTDVDIYDPATDTWTSGTPLGRPRTFVGGGAVKAKLYLVGGLTVDLSPSRATNQYDPLSNSWTARAQVPEAFAYDLGFAVRGNQGDHVRGTRIVVGGQPRLAILGGYGRHWQYVP